MHNIKNGMLECSVCHSKLLASSPRVSKAYDRHISKISKKHRALNVLLVVGDCILVGLQLRHLCRISGAKVSFGTDNARDSFYRASVNFVLSVCSRVTQPAGAVQIDGEKPTNFISGLADNIGLKSIRAARIICAAVAARTRSCFLQAWALEVQGKRPEVLEEMSKICQIFEIFPPEEYSPEMEMVASGLKKTLQIEQRKHLLTLFVEACSSKCKRTAEEALGLAVTIDSSLESFINDDSPAVLFMM